MDDGGMIEGCVDEERMMRMCVDDGRMMGDVNG